MTSQLLFAETFEVLDTEAHYVRVRLSHDDYCGWIDSRQTEELTERDYQWLNDLSHYGTTAECVGTASNGVRTQHLVRGTRLPGYGAGKFVLPGETWWFHGVVRQGSCLELPLFLECLSVYEHAPYLWGGRSPFGIDCSGLVQMAFRAVGVALPRDSLQQRACGIPIATLSATRPGDLAFFESGVDGSSHVGIVLPGQRVMHASAAVRDDRLAEEGIYHQETGKLTHSWKTFRRVVDFDSGKRL